MKLKSIAKPAAEAAVAPTAIKEARTKKPPKKAAPQGKTTKKRLVKGKSDKPIMPASGALTLESIIGLDERTRILETEDAPWRMICALEIDGPFGAFIGTGWLAGPRTVVTAGHCVFEPTQMGGWANSITLTPGRDGTEKPFGTVTSTRFSTTDVWLNDQNPDFDVAAIHLDDALGDEQGWFQVASMTDDALQGFMVNVSGYPGDRGFGTEQWWARNRIRAVTPRRIFYDVDTFGGQSGGPAFIVEKEGAPPVVVGIHAYGTGGTPSSIPFTVNSAPRIIPEVVEQIQGWIDQDGQGG